MRKTIEVVDDFLRKPLAAREQALGAEWAPADTYQTRTNDSFADPDATERIRAILGPGPVAPSTTLSGHFAFLGEGTEELTKIHVDESAWVGVVYLTRPDDCVGGISFHRDVSGGWEETMFVPMVFNRLVLFRADTLFHRPTAGFGHSPEAGRLAKVFHFDDESA